MPNGAGSFTLDFHLLDMPWNDKKTAPESKLLPIMTLAEPYVNT